MGVRVQHGRQCLPALLVDGCLHGELVLPLLPFGGDPGEVATAAVVLCSVPYLNYHVQICIGLLYFASFVNFGISKTHRR